MVFFSINIRELVASGLKRKKAKSLKRSGLWSVVGFAWRRAAELGVQGGELTLMSSSICRLILVDCALSHMLKLRDASATDRWDLVQCRCDWSFSGKISTVTELVSADLHLFLHCLIACGPNLKFVGLTHAYGLLKVRHFESHSVLTSITNCRLLFYKKPSYRRGTARRGRASWNLVKFCTNVDDLYLKSSETRLLPIRL